MITGKNEYKVLSTVPAHSKHKTNRSSGFLLQHLGSTPCGPRGFPSLDQRKCQVMPGTAWESNFLPWLRSRPLRPTCGSWHVGSHCSSLAVSLAAASIWKNFHKNQGAGKALRRASRRLLPSELRGTRGSWETCGPSRSTWLKEYFWLFVSQTWLPYCSRRCCRTGSRRKVFWPKGNCDTKQGSFVHF